MSKNSLCRAAPFHHLQLLIHRDHRGVRLPVREYRGGFNLETDDLPGRLDSLRKMTRKASKGLVFLASSSFSHAGQPHGVIEGGLIFARPPDEIHLVPRVASLK